MIAWLEPARRWWQEYTGEEETPLDGDTPAWVLSLFIHVAVLLSMAMLGIGQLERPRRSITIVSPPEVAEDVVLVPEVEASIESQEPASTDATTDSVDVTTAVAEVLAPNPIVPTDIATVDIGELVVNDVDALPTGAVLGTDMVAGRLGDGDSGVGTAGASGAVDRLTLEIARSLQQRSTVVCWVFDQSVSLAGQRKEIASRLGRVFEELGTTVDDTIENELLNLVYAYGQKVTPVVTEPARDAAVVVKAIESIPVDESGVEATFTAIGTAALKAKQVRISPAKRNVMIVAFTDEVGDDDGLADQVAAFCRVHAMRVYVVGVPAPFGRREVKMKFREFDPNYADEVQWAEVTQGPESLYPEFVRVRSRRGDDEPIDSGFGPFSLSKLCAETGGIYFCVHANRNASGRVSDGEVADMASGLRYFFDPEVMRDYRPNYQSAEKVDRMLAGNRAMKALVDAARSVEVAPMASPTTTFPRKDDGALALLLGEAQKAAAVILPRIDALHAQLAAGLPDRDKITEKRWQAGYDLALGRVAALKVRTDAYNTMLAQAKTGMKFNDPKNDTWELEPADDMSKAGSQTEKLANQATMLLKRVVAEHPGTPWAHMAAAELREPLGYKWTEKHTGVNNPRPEGAGNANAPADDARRKVAPPKPKRPVQKI